MENTNQTREIVYDMLLETFREHTPSHILLSQTLSKYQYLDKKERAFISRLYRGTLEYQIFLDAVIGQFSSVKVNKIKLPVRTILRMGIYQIMMMDHIPDSAACDESVKLAKRHGFKTLSAFVNGVLRNVSRKKNEIVYPDEQKDPAGYLSMKYSLPLWLVQMWMKSYGRETTEKMAAAMLAEQTTSVRIRLPLSEKAALTAGLRLQEIQVEDGRMVPDALKLSGYDYLGEVEAFTEGKITVQDESTMLAAYAAGIHEGDHIIDVCAAPGGKTMHMADLLKGTGRVISRDLTEDKIFRIEENITRTGLTNVETQVWDATVLSEKDVETADIVMADLPCSGLGVLGRKSDIKLTASKEKIHQLAELQRQILSVIWQYVKPGGVLVYCTCTIAEEENQKNAKWFEKHFPFEAESLDPYIPAYLHNEETAKGMIQILPGQYDSDGFFIARFRRKK